jgi:hypothetical protein
MRSVSLTPMKPLCVLSDSGQSTAWMRTKIRLPLPSPNHSSASGSSAIAGSGLNIEVSVASRSLPKRVDTASVVSTAAMPTPAA